MTPTPQRPFGRQVTLPPCGVQVPESVAGRALPHPRDQSVNITAQAPDPVIAVTKRDIGGGLVETDL